jgi:ADP-ribosylglycohydrolase
MLGAIAGDVVGSVYEGAAPPGKTFPLFSPNSRFTDDTVMTVAVASALRLGREYAAELHRWGRGYPDAGYGGLFRHWLRSDEPRPYGSFGNGSAMRVSAVAWACDDLDSVLAEAKRSAEVTHDHPEGIRGAQAVACALFLARTGTSKAGIRACLEADFGYDCSPTLDALRAASRFDATCQGTVPAAAVAFLASEGVEDAIRNAVSLGGDADTLACIAGALAEAFHGGVPDALAAEALARLDPPLRRETDAFLTEYVHPRLQPR